MGSLYLNYLDSFKISILYFLEKHTKPFLKVQFHDCIETDADLNPSTHGGWERYICPPPVFFYPLLKKLFVADAPMKKNR